MQEIHANKQIKLSRFFVVIILQTVPHSGALINDNSMWARTFGNTGQWQ